MAGEVVEHNPVKLGREMAGKDVGTGDVCAGVPWLSGVALALTACATAAVNATQNATQHRSPAISLPQNVK